MEIFNISRKRQYQLKGQTGEESTSSITMFHFNYDSSVDGNFLPQNIYDVKKTT